MKSTQILPSIALVTSILTQACGAPLAPRSAPAPFVAELTRQAAPAPVAGDPSLPSGLPVPAPGILFANSPLLGRLIYPREIDADRDPATNPNFGQPVPVIRFGAVGVERDLRYGVVRLAAAVTPDDARVNPAGTQVAFSLWNDLAGEKQISLTQAARSDAWGAVSAEFKLPDFALGGNWRYAMTAPGYTRAETRTFKFDPARFAAEDVLGAAQLDAAVEADGKLVIKIDSDADIDAGPGSIAIQAMRLSSDPEAGDQLLPVLLGTRLSTRTGAAELYLEPGRYGLVASVRSGSLTARTPPVIVNIVPRALPAPVEILDQAIDDSGDTWATYRAASGNKVIAKLPDGGAAVPAASPAKSEAEAAAPQVFTHQERVGAFSVRTTVYQLNTEILADDHKKKVALSGMDWDAGNRAFNIDITSLMTQTVDDKVTLKVYGPNHVVIHEETQPARLLAGANTRVVFVVPASVGEPKGVQITVHDPFTIDGFFALIRDAVESTFWVIKDAAQFWAGNQAFVIGGVTGAVNLGLVKLIPLYKIGLDCNLANTPTCVKQEDGVLFRLRSAGYSAALDFMAAEISKALFESFGLATNKWNQLGALDALESMVLELVTQGIKVGSAEGALKLGGRARRQGVFPGDCPDPQDLAAKRVTMARVGRQGKAMSARITSAIQAKAGLVKEIAGKAYVPLGGPISLRPTANIKPGFEAADDGDYFVYDLAIEGTVGLEVFVDPPTALLRKLEDMGEAMLKGKDLILAMYSALDAGLATRELMEYFQAFRFNVNQRDCSPRLNPDPPDDRIDAFQNGYLPTVEGVSGQVEYLQAKLVQAQRLNLSRVARYWELQLRRAELRAFVADSAYADVGRLEYQFALQQAGDRALKLIDGILPIPAGKTLNEAVIDEISAGYSRAFGNAYDARRQLLRDAVDFAERRYNELRGQELEFLREMRLMEQGSGIGVLDYGFVANALYLGQELGLDMTPVMIVPGFNAANDSAYLTNYHGTAGQTAQIIRPPGRYFSPLEAPPLLIVPSGGLSTLSGSAEARDWLEAYVISGGLLVVLAQRDDQDWEALPGGQVRGLGSDTDVLCTTQSVFVTNDSIWLNSFSSNLPNVMVDGSFTAWPNDAKVILTRRTGNELPAMIEYPYGLGKVVAMTMFPDFVMSSNYSRDDRVFAESFFNTAYHLANNLPLPPALNPGGLFSVTETLVNPLTRPAAKLRHSANFRDVFGSAWWRGEAGLDSLQNWGQPFLGLDAISDVTLAPALASGFTRTMAFNHTAPPYSGVYRAGFAQLVTDTVTSESCSLVGGQPTCNTTTTVRETTAGKQVGAFFRVASPLHPPAFDLLRDKYQYNFNDVATVTARITNTAGAPRSFQVVALSGLGFAPISITLAAGAGFERAWPVTVTQRVDVRVEVREAGESASRNALTLVPFLPTMRFDLDTDRVLANVTGTVRADVRFLDNAGLLGGSVVAFDIGGPASASFTAPIVISGTTASAGVTLTLPPAPATHWNSPPPFAVRASAGSQSMLRQILVQAPAALRSAEFAGPLVMGQNNSAAITATVDAIGLDGQVELRAIVGRFDGNTFSPILTGAIASVVLTGQRVFSVLLDVPLPASLAGLNGQSVVVRVTASASAANGGRVESSRDLALQLPILGFRAGSAARDPASVTAFYPPRPGQAQLPASATWQIVWGDGYAGNQQYTQTAASGVATGEFMRYASAVPNIWHGGTWTVRYTTPALDRYWEDARVEIDWPDVRLEVEPDPLPGGVVTAFLSNAGGVDTTFSGTLTLVDSRAVVIAARPLDTAMAAGARLPFTLTVPGQIGTGRYSVVARGENHLGWALAPSDQVRIAALDTSLSVAMSQAAYRPGDVVSATVRIQTSGPLTDAKLRLQVLGPDQAPVSAGEPWPKLDGTNETGPELRAPVTATWMITGGTFTAPYGGSPQTATQMLIESGLFSVNDLVLHYASDQAMCPWRSEIHVFDCINACTFGVESYGYPALTARDAHTGEKQWSVCGQGGFGRTAVMEDRVALMDVQGSNYSGSTELWDGDGGALHMGYGLVTATLKVLRLTDGSEMWSREIHSNSDTFSTTHVGTLLASDFGILVSDRDYGGWRVFDPTTGDERGVIPFGGDRPWRALLKDNRLVFAINGETRSYNVTTLAQDWTLNLMEALAVNDQYVLHKESEQRLVEGLPVNFSVFVATNAGTGAIEQLISITDTLHPAYAAMRGGKLYLTVAYGNSYPYQNRELREYDLATGEFRLAADLNAMSVGNLYYPVLTGNRLWSIYDTYPSVDILSGTLAASNVAPDCRLFTAVWWRPDSINADGFMCPMGNPYVSGFQQYHGTWVVPTPSAQLAVLREEVVLISTTGAITIEHAFGAPDLLADPRARGRLVLKASLFSEVPADEPVLARHHRLAETQTAFAGLAANQVFTPNLLYAEREQYRAVGQELPETYAESAPRFFGSVTNDASYQQTLNLVVRRPDAYGGEAYVYEATVSDLQPGLSSAFTFTDAFPQVGTVPYTLSVNWADSAYASVEVVPVVMQNNLSFDAPYPYYYGKPGTIVQEVTNPSAFGGFVRAITVSGMGQPMLVISQMTVPPSSTVTFRIPFTPTLANGAAFSSTYKGDFCEYDEYQPFGYACPWQETQSNLTMQTESTQLTLALSGSAQTTNTIAGPGALRLTYLSVPPGENPLALYGFTFDAILTYTLRGPVARTDISRVTILSGTYEFLQSLDGLPSGAYTALYTATSAVTGRVLGTAARNFNVAVPRRAAAIAASVGGVTLEGETVINVTATAPVTNDVAWSGVLNWAGGLAAMDALTLEPGQSAALSKTLNATANVGSFPVTVTLTRDDGAISDARALLLNGVGRAAPQARLLGFGAGVANVGGTVDLNVTIANPGSDGDAQITFGLFDTTREQLIGLTANATRTYTVSLPVPADLADGLTSGSARMFSAMLKTDVTLSGPAFSLTHGLNKPDYAPFETAVWTLAITGTRGAPAPYDVSLIYAGREQTRTVTLGAGLSKIVSFTFDVGPGPERASVLLQTAGNAGAASRRNLLIDTAAVDVRADARVHLYASQPRYQAGQIVSLTLGFDAPVRSAILLAPDPFFGMVWSSQMITPTTEFVRISAFTGTDGISRTLRVTETGSFVGTQVVTVALPTVMPTGRYTFRLIYDGEERLLPIDVFGANIRARAMAVQVGGTPAAGLRPQASGSLPVSVTLDARSDVTLTAVRVFMYAIGPDGRSLDLGSGALVTVPLVAGANRISLAGTLTPRAPGAHRIVVFLRDPASGILLGGDERTVDVGLGALTDLQTSRGVYAPGQPGSATVSAYTRAAAQVRVTTSGGGVLLNTALTQTGHLSLTFPIPTGVEMDELVIAVMTDSHGMTSSLMAAYKVAATFDITPPMVLIQSPAPATISETVVVRLAAAVNRAITVQGTITNEIPAIVLVNGITATLNGANWSAPLTLEDGANFIEVLAYDAAGNVGYSTVVVYGNPVHDVGLFTGPFTRSVGSPVTVTGALTSGVPFTGSALLSFSNGGFDGLTTRASATKASNTYTLWSGATTAGQIIPLTWSGAATRAVTGTFLIVVQADGLVDAPSFAYAYTLLGGAPGPGRAMLPRVLR